MPEQKIAKSSARKYPIAQTKICILKDTTIRYPSTLAFLQTYDANV